MHRHGGATGEDRSPPPLSCHGSVSDSSTRTVADNQVFAVLLLLRVLLRRDFAAWLGLGALWAILSLPSGNVSTIGLVGIAAGTALLLLAMRMGLLATVSAWMTNFLFAFVTPLTLDFSRWYAWRTVAIAALLLAIAAWSFRAAMGRHKILTAAMFEG